MKKTGKKKHKQKNCVSSDYFICKLFLSYYHNLTHIAFPSGKNRRRYTWNQTNYQSYLTRLNSQWSKKNDHLLRQLTPMSTASGLLQPSHLQFKDFNTITLSYIQKQLSIIKSKMRGTDRMEMRIKINSKIRHHEDLRQQGKLKQLIKLLTGNPFRELDLQTLP
jgi:hypothetical protein